jgi:hypothetical protein
MAAAGDRGHASRTLLQQVRIMGLIGSLVFGLVAGAIAKALHKGDAPGGLLGTLAVGVGTWLIALGGAFLLLVAFDALAGRGSARRSDGVRA